MSTLEDKGNEPDDEQCPECNFTSGSWGGVKAHYGKMHNGSLQPTLICDWCDSPFQVKPKRVDTARTCSKECDSSLKRGGEKPSAELLHRLHWEEQIPILKMAELLGFARISITRWMDDYGIKHRGRSEAERLKWEQMSDEQRAAQVAAAHEITREMAESGEHHWQLDTPERLGYGEGWTDEKKEQAREKYGRVCQGCGVPEADYLESFGNRLDVHHIIPAAYFDGPVKRNALENLIPMCRSCHRKYEGIPLRPQLAD